VRGEFGGVLGVELLFLGCRGEAAGGASGDGELQELALASFCCTFRQGDGFRGHAGSREGV
jgi:hypothetical protein